MDQPVTVSEGERSDQSAVCLSVSSPSGNPTPPPAELFIHGSVYAGPTACGPNWAYFSGVVNAKVESHNQTYDSYYVSIRVYHDFLLIAEETSIPASGGERSQVYLPQQALEIKPDAVVRFEFRYYLANNFHTYVYEDAEDCTFVGGSFSCVQG